MNRNSNTGIFWIMAFVFLLWAAVLTYKYLYLGFYDWDLAFFNQSFWNMIQGRQYSSIFGYNFLGDHASYIVLFLLPAYALFPSPLTLLYIKAAAFALSLYWLYRLAHEKLGHAGAVAIVLLFSFFVPNCFALLYEFSMECFAPLFIFMMFDAWRRKDLRLFWIVAVLLCLTKENLILVVMAFGMYGLIQRRSFAWNWGAILFSCVGLAMAMVTVKCFRGEEGVSAWLRYKHLFAAPMAMGQSLFSAWNARFLADLFSPCGAIAFISPASLVLGVPIFLLHALSIHPTEHSIFYFYGFAMTPFIFVALIDSLAWVGSRFGRKMFVVFLVLFMMGCGVGAIRYKNVLWQDVRRFSDTEVAFRWELIQKIPPQAGVVTSFDVLAPLSSRLKAYSFYKVYNDKFQDPEKSRNTEFAMGKIFELPEDVTYALVDTHDPWMTDSQPEKIRIRKFFSDGWKLMEQRGGLKLFHRQGRE